MGLPVRHRKARVGIGDCRGGEGVRGKKKKQLIRVNGAAHASLGSQGWGWGL